MNHIKHECLTAMDTPKWLLVTRPSKARPEANKPALTLDVLQKRAATCNACALHTSRTQSVFSRGNPSAKLMVIGEAPGFYEDKQGEPFVGKAGQLLNKMLSSIGLSDDSVYIANVIKCRPPENRDPREEEIHACSKYLTAQIECVQPALIFAVGRFAGQFLIQDTAPLSKMRSNIHQYQNIPVIVSYHPAYLLRNPKDKKKAYHDLLKAKSYINA